MLTSSSLSQAKHANGEHQFGVDGDTGKVTDMQVYGLLESASVKIQTLKTAIEVSGSCRYQIFAANSHPY